MEIDVYDHWPESSLLFGHHRIYPNKWAFICSSETLYSATVNPFQISVLRAQCCQCLRIVHFWLPPSVVTNVYWKHALVVELSIVFFFKYIFTLSNKRRSHLSWNIFLWHDVIFTHGITWCNLCACFSSGSKCRSVIDVVCFCKFDMNGSSCLDG
jgi:hypothetical protein